jgi:hypothetical protein
MAKTEELPGVEGEGVGPQKKIKALDNAVSDWRSKVAQRMALGEQEVEARNKVVSLMHKHNLVKYPYWESDEEKKLLVLDSTEKLKLTKAVEADKSETADDNDKD